MNKSSLSNDAPVGVAAASVAIGAVAVLLLFLPILSIPLGGLGVLFALAGIAWSLRGDTRSLRWSIAGLVVAGAALCMGIAIDRAPADHPRTPSIPLHLRHTHAQPYVAPPARPGQ
jgi:hypothetical protein